jgi:D-amino-acid oxidase
MATPIAVIGSGIIGLSTALRLLEEGYSVTVIMRDLKLNLASRAAPALFLPYKIGPEHLVAKWANTSVRYYDKFSNTPGAGVDLMDAVVLGKSKTVPMWLKARGNYSELTNEHLPAEFEYGYKGTTFRIDSDIFLDYLIDQIVAHKGIFMEKNLRHFSGIDPNYGIIVNCTGVSARQLVPDKTVFPIQGQYVLTTKPPGLNKITSAEVDDNSYILVVPRTKDCWLGGTAINNEWSSVPDPQKTEFIFSRAKLVEPALEKAKILSAGIGLRPGRETVRIETEEIVGKRKVIHNYGHGGGGFSTAWGCADEVVRLIAELT